MALPRKVGGVTLMRAVVTDGVHTAYAGILDDPPGKECMVRRIPSALLRDPAHAALIGSRIGDFLPIRHASVLGVIAHLIEGDEQYVVTEWADTVSLAEVVNWCIKNDVQIPHNLFLHIATGICNALEALHGRPGASTGSEAVLHLALNPATIGITRDGAIRLGGFGLVPSPTTTAHSGGLKIKRLYISPEQTGLEQDLTPSTDLFSLGTVLYELLTHKSMFSSGSPLRIIAMVRRAEVTTQLLEIKEIFPGLDRVMYRVLAKNPRHRFQRAFVLREDLRALMAGYSFSNIEADARNFLEPLFAGERRALEEMPLPFVAPDGETTLSLLDDSDGIEAPKLLLRDITPEVLAPPIAMPSRPPSMPHVLPSPQTPTPPGPPRAPTPALVQTPPKGPPLVPLFTAVVIVTALVAACAGLVLLGLFSSV